jgi:hypothetical protein
MVGENRVGWENRRKREAERGRVSLRITFTIAEVAVSLLTNHVTPKQKVMRNRKKGMI